MSELPATGGLRARLDELEALAIGAIVDRAVLRGLLTEAADVMARTSWADSTVYELNRHAAGDHPETCIVCAKENARAVLARLREAGA